MKKIEIITPQNVAIEYELAGLPQRIMAAFVDYVMLIMAFGLISAIFLRSAGPGALWAIFIVFSFYTLVSEWMMNGQTLGKKSAGIKVIRKDGAPLQFTDSATRWLLRLIDIFFSFGFLGCILISSSKWHQRLGDVIANTVVIKVQTSSPPRLEELLEFKNAGEYNPVYMHYLVFEQQEIILAKITLDRAKKYRNDAHMEALNMMAEKIRTRLDNPQLARISDAELIRGVITDYVMLTR